MKHRGFTLTELVVTMAVTAVILVSLLAMLASLSRFQAAQTQRSQIQEELTCTENYITQWFSARDTASNPPPVIQGDSLFFGGSALCFDPEQGCLRLDSAQYSCQYIRQIRFHQSSGDPGLIKCTVSYQSEDITDVYVFMLLKRSVNT